MLSKVYIPWALLVNAFLQGYADLQKIKLPDPTVPEKPIPRFTGDHGLIMHYVWYKSCVQEKGVIRKKIDDYDYTLIRHGFIQEDVDGLVNRSISSIQRRLSELYAPGLIYHRQLQRPGNEAVSDLWLLVPSHIAYMFTRRLKTAVTENTERRSG